MCYRNKNKIYFILLPIIFNSNASIKQSSFFDTLEINEKSPGNNCYILLLSFDTTVVSEKVAGHDLKLCLIIWLHLTFKICLLLTGLGMKNAFTKKKEKSKITNKFFINSKK